MPRVINRFRGKYFFLSNFFPVPGDVHGYPTVEHAYVAAKTTDRELRRRIKACPDPAAAKKLGRSIPLRPDWEAVRLEVMEYLLRRKFSHPELREKLLATGDAVLAEENCWHDNFWGDCTCDRCKATPGQNHLGRLLMKIRDELRSWRRLPRRPGTGGDRSVGSILCTTSLTKTAILLPSDTTNGLHG